MNIKTVIIAVKSVVLCVCLLGCQAAGIAIDKSSSQVIDTFVIASIPSSGEWGKLTHPFLREISGSRLAITYWVNGDSTLAGEAPVSWPIYSDDGGTSWLYGNPFDIESGATNDVDLFISEGDSIRSSFNLGLFFAPMTLPDGRKYFHQREFGRRQGRIRGFGVRQKMNNEMYDVISVEYHWGELDRALRGDRLKVENPGVVLGDGTMLTAGYGINHKNGKYTSYLFESTDGGDNFVYRSIIALPEDSPWGRVGPCEPMLVMLDDNELVVVMRTDGGGAADMGGLTSMADMIVARSSDMGNTWHHTRMAIGGVMPKIIRLTDGRLALACGRPGNRIYFSDDRGRTWQDEISLYPGQRTTGYIDIIEIRPGTLLAVHDIRNGSIGFLNTMRGEKISGILGTLIQINQQR